MLNPLLEPVVIDEPIIEPVSLQEMRDQCRIDVQDAGQDSLLQGYISVARDYVEWRTARTFHQKTLLWILNFWPYYAPTYYASVSQLVELPMATPLIEIDFIKYMDSGGNDNTWDPSQYSADVYSTPGGFKPNYGVAFPSFAPHPVNPIRIQYKAGIATTSPGTEAPEKVKQPIRLLAAAMFDNRESESLPSRSAVQFTAQKIGGFESLLLRLTAEHAF